MYQTNKQRNELNYFIKTTQQRMKAEADVDNQHSGVAQIR
jgi:hypothetical protein